MEILGALPQIFEELKLHYMLPRSFSLSGCIHIGAHWGQEYSLYKDLGIDNLLFYEPLKNNFNTLKDRVGNEVDLRNVALGNTCGMIDMFVEEINNSCSSSVLEPEYHLKQYPHIVFPTKEQVRITKLDEEIFNRKDFNFINIDVQGYELEVFKGAVKTLESIDVIISEINKEEMYKNCARVNDLDEYLKGFDFFRVATHWQDGETWGDGLYVKNKDLYTQAAFLNTFKK